MDAKYEIKYVDNKAIVTRTENGVTETIAESGNIFGLLLQLRKFSKTEKAEKDCAEHMLRDFETTPGMTPEYWNPD